jgi:hypothetical protein
MQQQKTTVRNIRLPESRIFCKKLTLHAFSEHTATLSLDDNKENI